MITEQLELKLPKNTVAKDIEDNSVPTEKASHMRENKLTCNNRKIEEANTCHDEIE